MELRQYAAIAWRWCWLLALGMVLAGLVAFLLSRAQTPVYEASGTILVNEAQNVSRPTFSDVQANQQLTKTYSEIVTSGPVLERVGPESGFSYEELRKKVNASARRDTQLIDVTVRDTDPERAAALANTIARAFAQQIQETQAGQQTAVEQDLERQAAAIRGTLDQARQTASQLGAQQAQLSDPERWQQWNGALAQVETLSQRLTTVEDNLQDLRIERVKSTSSVTLVNPARVPDAPVSPRVLFNTVLGALLGLIAAAGVVAVVEYLDDTVKTAADVTRAVGLATLGTIGRFRHAAKRPGERPEEEAPALGMDESDGYSPTGEAYRMVRTNLEFARGGRSGRTILITSALPGEGKSTTAANLANAQAQTGRRVILVDTDLRRPTLHRRFGLPNATGLSTLFVMEQPALAGLLRPTPMENLLLLPSGPLPPNPAELLASERMGEIIALLEAEADVILFDSPPLLSVADGVTLAARLDGVVLVVDAGRSRTTLLARAAEMLQQARAKVWGVVLNRAKDQSGEGYYYYGNARERTQPRATARPVYPTEAVRFESNGHHDASNNHPIVAGQSGLSRPRARRTVVRESDEPRQSRDG